MNKITYILLFIHLFSCQQKEKESSNKGSSTTRGTTIKVEADKSVYLPSDSIEDSNQKLPIHGEINKEELNIYYPAVTDTINDLRIIGAEQIKLDIRNGIIVSMLHNYGSFNQMILCTHDSNLILVDNLYIGKATEFDRTSHTIEYHPIDSVRLKFNHVDWGYVKKREDYEIDTVKYDSYIISISDNGIIKKTKSNTVYNK